MNCAFRPLIEPLESRRLLSAGPAAESLPLAESLTRVTKTAASPLASLKGTYTGTITDDSTFRQDTRLVISKVAGKQIIGKIFLGTKTGVGVFPFTFDCSNSKFKADAKNRLTQFSLSIPGQYGPLILTGNLTTVKVGTKQVIHMTGKFHAFYAGGQAYKGNYVVDKK